MFPWMNEKQQQQQQPAQQQRYLNVQEVTPSNETANRMNRIQSQSEAQLPKYKEAQQLSFVDPQLNQFQSQRNQQQASQSNATDPAKFLFNKQKQEYQDFYRQNVSEFANKRLEDKKEKFQNLMSQPNRRQIESSNSFSQPTQSLDYATILRQQIELKKQLDLEKQKNEDALDFYMRSNNPPVPGQQLQQQSLNSSNEDMMIVNQLQNINNNNNNMNNQQQQFQQQQQQQYQPAQQQLSQNPTSYRGVSNQPSQREDYGRRDDGYDSINEGLTSDRRRQAKSMAEQLGENFEMKQAAKQREMADFAQDLQHQIKEKKRMQRLQKEKEDLIERQYEEKIKADVEELNQRHKLELAGKQHQIKTVKSHANPSNESALVGVPPMKGRKAEPTYVPLNDAVAVAAAATPNVRQVKFQHSPALTGTATPNLNVQPGLTTVLSMDMPNQATLMSYQSQQPLQYQDSVENSIYAGREISQEWNPPQFWAYNEKKNERDLAVLRTNLENETLAMEAGAARMRNDARVASEMKGQALIDLENLKDQLKRQNIVETMKLRELKSTFAMGSAGDAAVFGFNLNNGDNSAAKGTNNANFGVIGQELLPADSVFGSIESMKMPYESKRKYEQKQTDILDQLVSDTGQTFMIETKHVANNPKVLGMKLDKRLAGMNLSKADLQLLEVDNLLANIRSGY